jgi:oligoribonuclease NrnB/cAMP/cGMP phosphodiesterase (DHH superfamily)
MKNYNFIIFHRGCIDGFSSFVILNKTKYIDDDATIWQDVPSTNTVPQNIDGKNIIIMDVAYKHEVLQEIVSHANSVLFIDHHKTIHDDSQNIKADNLEIIYDTNECGASLTWKYFFPKKSLPLFIKYVRDNDIGTWKLHGTHAFIAGLEVNYNMSINHKNLKKWNNLFDTEHINKLKTKGKIYREYIDSLLDYNSKKYSMMLFPSEQIYSEYTSYFNKPGQYKVAVICGSGCPSSSLLGHKIMETVNCDFALFWSLHLDKKEYVVVFRSLNVDVGSIAQMFGGGGHKLASACSFPMTKYNITDLFFSQSLPRQSK